MEPFPKPNKQPGLVQLFPVLIVLAGFILSGCSLAEDVTPPPGYQAPTAPPQTGPGAIVPVAAPDLSSGAGIYAQKCAPCHGTDGLGDGPQAAQLPTPPASLGDPALARKTYPADWYTMVSKGRLDRFMPGFSQSLTSDQIWDVVWYAYSLSATPTLQQQGAQVFQGQCASCHGAGGKGDGTRATQGKLNDLTDPAWQASQAEANIYQAISAGGSPGMPAFSGKLTADQIWAVTGYIRMLAASGGQLASAASTPQPAGTEAVTTTPQATAPGVSAINSQGTPLANATTAAGPFGSIAGQISNGSGGTVPPDLQVTLHGYDTSAQEIMTQTTTADASGKYVFPRVDEPAGHGFMVTVDYKTATFDSQIVQSQAGGAPINLPVTIYEPTTDASALQVDRMHVFFDFSSPGDVQIVQLYIISNSGNKAVVSPGAGQPILKFQLPQGASNLQFQQGQMGGRFVSLDNGFGDTQSIAPGTDTGQVLFTYSIPYTNQLNLNLPLTMPIKSAVVMIPKVGVQLQGKNLTDGGDQDVQGVTFHIYTASNLAAGSVFSMALSGAPGQTGAGSPLIVGSTATLVIGLVVFVLVIGLAGYWFFKVQRAQQVVIPVGEKRRKAPAYSDKEDADSLIDAIIALDDQYQSGEIPEKAYRERRQELKSRLAGLNG